MSGIEEIYDEAPTEPEVTETPAEETPTETTVETKADVVEELAEGTTPEAKESETPEAKEEETPETTEQELAEAALEETAPKDTVPLAKYMAEKNARREAEDRATRAEGAVEALQKPAEKKPTSVQDMIDAGRIEPDDAVPAGIWAEIEANKAEAAQTQPKTGRQAFLEKAASSEATIIAETTIEKVGEGMDYETVVAAGKGNLSVRDQAEIVRSDDPCRTLYELCIKRTPELQKVKDGAVVKDTKDTKTAPKPKKPKDTPIPKGTAEQQQAGADAEVEFMEAEMDKPEDQQLQEIRELSKVPG